MAEQMFKILKNLKAIEPDSEFKERSRISVLAVSKKARWLKDSLMFTVALAFTSLTLFVAFGGLSSLNLPRPSANVLSSLNQRYLNSEIKNLTIDIQIKEVKYGREEAVAQINRALHELSF